MGGTSSPQSSGPKPGSPICSVGTVGADITTSTISNPACNTTYYYRVRAYNAIGDSSYSNVAHAQTLACLTPPAAPSNLAATALSSREIRLNGTDNSTNEIGFRIERSPDGTTGWTEVGSVGMNAVTFADSGLSCSSSYSYRVRAYNNAGNSNYSNVATAVTQGCGLSSAPVSLTTTVEVATLTVVANGETRRSYYYFSGQRVAMREVDAGGEDVLYLLGDHLGSTSLTIDGNGAKVAEARYYPYGQERWSSGTLPTDYRFTGQQQIDSAGGIYHMGARFYDASLARWLSADTIAPDPSNPQSLNRYSWVLANPLKYVDPTGYKEEGACSDPNEECIDDEIYEAYWAYCTQNPDDAACQPGDVGEAALFFLAGVSGTTLLEDLVTIGVGSLWEGIQAGGQLVAKGASATYKALVSASARCLSNPLCASIVYGASSTSSSNPVNGTEDLLQLRQAYEQEVRAIGEEANRRLAAGESVEQVARWAHQTRRALGVDYKALTPQPLLEQIYARNIEKYGDRLGPSIEWLLNQGKTWMDIIRSASSPGGADIKDKLMGQ